MRDLFTPAALSLDLAATPFPERATRGSALHAPQTAANPADIGARDGSSRASLRPSSRRGLTVLLATAIGAGTTLASLLT